MRYIITLIWAVLLGQVVGYLGGALSSTPYDFTLTTIFSVVAAILIMLIAHFAVPSKKEAQE